MQAIETVYDGHRFRSRLEARWAVFFNTYGINYEYEFEGFESNGTRYLPDFYLPDINRWFEVKGTKISKPDFEKILNFCFEKSSEDEQFKYSILMGSPKLMFVQGKIPEQIPLGIKTFRFSNRAISNISELADSYPWVPFIECAWQDCSIPIERLYKAIDAAKQARFEFGGR